MSDPTISFLDPEVQKCPYGAYRELRKDGPVYFDESCGFYMVFGYDEIRQITADPATFSSVTGLLLVKDTGEQEHLNKVFEEHGFVPVNTLVVADPPIHTFHRSLVYKAFNAIALKRMEAFLEITVGRIVDQFLGKGEGDFYTDVAAILPSYVIADQMGFSSDDFEKFRTWTDAVVAEANPNNTPAEQLEITRTICDLHQHISEKADDFLLNPRPCLLSDMVHADVDGQRLTRQELVSIFVILIAGAHDTTTSSLCSALYRLAKDRELQDRLRENSTLITKFVEEVLRFDSPVAGLFRRATCDTMVGEIPIAKDSLLMIRYGAANRDPKMFEHPDTFNIDRTNASRHLSFGSGPHTCVGNLLARAELRIAVANMLKKTREIRLKDGEASVSWLTQFIVYGPNRLELAFSPA